MGRCNALWYRPDLNTFVSRCSWSPYKKPQKPLKPSNIMKHLGIHPQSIIFLNIMAHFNNSILEIFTNNLVTYLYGFALKLWYAQFNSFYEFLEGSDRFYFVFHAASFCKFRNEQISECENSINYVLNLPVILVETCFYFKQEPID